MTSEALGVVIVCSDQLGTNVSEDGGYPRTYVPRAYVRTGTYVSDYYSVYGP